jgi:hypothetical protein
MLEDAGLAAATISMALQDTPSTAHAAEHEGVIYHQVVSNNTSSNTRDSSYYRHSNDDDEQDAPRLSIIRPHAYTWGGYGWTPQSHSTLESH